MIAKLKFPFHVKRVTFTQDENGDPIEVDQSWDSFCGYTQMRTQTKLDLGLTTDIEVINITYKYWPGREMRVEDIVTLLDKQWTHFGVPKFDNVGHIRYITQSLRHG